RCTSAICCVSDRTRGRSSAYRVLASTSWASRLDSLARSREARAADRAVQAGAAATVAGLGAGAGIDSSFVLREVRRVWLIFRLAWTSARVVSNWDRRWAASALLAGIWMPPRDMVKLRSAVSLRASVSDTWAVCWDRYARVLFASSTLNDRVRDRSTSM